MFLLETVGSMKLTYSYIGSGYNLLLIAWRNCLATSPPRPFVSRACVLS